MFSLSKEANTNVPIQAKAEAILWALHIASSLDPFHFVIEVTPNYVLMLLLAEAVTHLGQSLILLALLESCLGSFCFSWIHHEANGAAHELASWSCKNVIYT